MFLGERERFLEPEGPIRAMHIAKNANFDRVPFAI